MYVHYENFHSNNEFINFRGTLQKKRKKATGKNFKLILLIEVVFFHEFES